MIKNFVAKIWSKVARRVLSLASGYVLIITRYVIFAVIGMAGSKMILEKPPAPGLWSEWSGKTERRLIVKQNEKGWVGHYLSRAFKKGNLWMIFLLPFILILKATGEAGAEPSPESLMIYTLF